MQGKTTPPPDLEMRVRTLPENGRTRLSYSLHSPSGSASFFHREIAGPTIQGNPEEYHARLLQKLGNLTERLDVDRTRLLQAEIERKLASLGRQLWRELFPPELRQAYRDLRRSVKTWSLVSDEPWIPWELIKPFDDSRTDDPMDDDFLALRFELTRWLVGDKMPAPEMGVHRLAAIRTAENLPQSGEELRFLTGLAAQAGIEIMLQAPDSADDLLKFLETGGINAFHFLGHGRFIAESPDDSPIPLPDGSLLRPGDLEGPLLTRIGQARPLVVLNACWGAQQGWTLTRIGGWAARWVGVAGCGAFVAPLWPVRDQAALAFTRIFYEALARGATLGQAGLEARQHLRETRPGDPSALAYVVYGDPNARLLFRKEQPRVTHPISFEAAGSQETLYRPLVRPDLFKISGHLLPMRHNRDQRQHFPVRRDRPAGQANLFYQLCHPLRCQPIFASRNISLIKSETSSSKRPSNQSPYFSSAPSNGSSKRTDPWSEPATAELTRITSIR